MSGVKLNSGNDEFEFCDLSNSFSDDRIANDNDSNNSSRAI
jgi:hypothetical protein